MNITTKDTSRIHEEVNKLLYIIEHKKRKDQMAAMASLEGILLLGAHLDRTILNFDNKIFGKPTLLKQYAKQTSKYYNSFIENFHDNKSFHQRYLKDILNIIGKALEEVGEDYRSFDYSYLSEEECLDIMSSYLKSIKKDDLLTELIEEKRIFHLKKLDGNNGEAVHIINNGKGFIFLENTPKNIISMTTLIHELGHIDDFITMDKKYSINDKFKVNFLSIYNEVNSKILEKDFLYYLIDNNILKEESIDFLIDLYWKDYDEILSTYILSFLPRQMLTKDKYSYLTAEKITNMLPENLHQIQPYIEELELNLQDDISYAYGFIISEFLTDKENIDIFYNNYRSKIFDKRYIIDQDLSVEKFKKIYQKKLEKLK